MDRIAKGVPKGIVTSIATVDVAVSEGHGTPAATLVGTVAPKPNPSDD